VVVTITGLPSPAATRWCSGFWTTSCVRTDAVAGGSARPSCPVGDAIKSGVLDAITRKGLFNDLLGFAAGVRQEHQQPH